MNVRHAVKLGPQLILSVALLLCARNGAAQNLSLEFNNGLVTLAAREVSLVQILERWAEVGGATIINGIGASNAPITVQFVDVPQREALDILLREMNGYVLTARKATSREASLFDRILILPKSAAPQRGAVPRLSTERQDSGANSTASAPYQAPPPPGSDPVAPVERIVMRAAVPGAAAGQPGLGVPDAGPPGPPPVVRDRPIAPSPVVDGAAVAAAALAAPGPQAAPNPSGAITGTTQPRESTTGLPGAQPEYTPPTHIQQAAPNPFGITVGTTRPGESTPAPPEEPREVTRPLPPEGPTDPPDPEEVLPPGRQ